MIETTRGCSFGRPGRLRRILAGVFAAGMVASAVGSAAQTTPAPVSMSAEDLHEYLPIAVAEGAPKAHPLTVAAPGHSVVDAAGLAQAQAYSDAHGGFALLVWQGGKIRYEHYAPGFGQDSRFETYSMHKSVMGLVYGAALRDGVIGSIDDPAGKYLTEWRDDPRGKITIRQILWMESGLKPFSAANHDPQATQIAYGDQVTRSALESQVAMPPQTRFEYNNANSQIAGAILNRALKAAGKGDYPSYVSRVLLKPLGAGDAHFWLEHEGGDPRFFAHFQVRPRDWLRIGIMLSHHGRFAGQQVIPAAWIAQMTTPSPRNPNYGLQLWLGSPWTRWRAYSQDNPLRVPHQAPYLVDDLVFFDGFGGERVYTSASRDLVIVRIGKSDMTFDDSVIPNAILAGLPESASKSAPKS